MLAPGGEATVSITLMNIGRDDNFRIDIDTDASDEEKNFFNYAVTPSIVSVRQNMTADISVEISLSHNAPTGFSITFTLIAQSVDDIDATDYITFDLTKKQMNQVDQTNPKVNRVLMVKCCTYHCI